MFVSNFSPIQVYSLVQTCFKLLKESWKERHISIVWHYIIRAYRYVSFFFSSFMASLAVDDLDGGIIMLFAPDLISVFPFGIPEVTSTFRVIRELSLTSLMSVFVSSLLASLVSIFWLLNLRFLSSSSDNNRSPKGSSKSYTNKNQDIIFESGRNIHITNSKNEWYIKVFLPKPCLRFCISIENCTFLFPVLTDD